MQVHGSITTYVWTTQSHTHTHTHVHVGQWQHTCMYKLHSK